MHLPINLKCIPNKKKKQKSNKRHIEKIIDLIKSFEMDGSVHLQFIGAGCNIAEFQSRIW